MKRETRFIGFEADIDIQPPVWQVIEPNETTDPVKHEQFDRVELDRHLVLYGASIRGKKHANDGQWREDAYHYAQINHGVIISVADGVGKCSLSRLGAVIASTEAVNFAQSFLMNISSSFMLTEDLLKECLGKSLAHAVNSIEIEAEKRNLDPNQLSTTFILVVLSWAETSQQIAVLNIGDGMVALLDASDGVTIANRTKNMNHFEKTASIPFIKDYASPFADMKVFKMNSLKSIAMLTDGIADDFFPYDTGMEFLFKEIFSCVFN